MDGGLRQPWSGTSPPLPVELKREILLYCDPPTLAGCCLVCHDFLDLCGPLLYKDVYITSVDQLAQLFRQEVRPCRSMVCMHRD